MPGVFTHVIGPWDVDWYGERSALVVACPGKDLIRVWSLPVELSWFANPKEPGVLDVKPCA